MVVLDWSDFDNWPDDQKWKAVREHAAQVDANFRSLQTQVNTLNAELQKIKKRLNDLDGKGLD